MAELDIDRHVSHALIQKFELQRAHKVKDIHGGIVNQAALYDTDVGRLFVKYSQRPNAMEMFTSEMKSLKLVDSVKAIRVPRPIKVMSLCGGGAAFALEYIENLRPITSTWAELGTQIAKMHKHNLDLLDNGSGCGMFGSDFTTFVGADCGGSVGWVGTFEEYFIRDLLEPQFTKVELKTGDRKVLELWSELQLHADKAFRDVVVRPSLCHGDLCYINVGQADNQPVLFDPQCTYSHSELDLVIPLMENNFPEEFYKHYHTILPRQERGLKVRQCLYLLYANMIMYNFGAQDQEHVIHSGSDFLSAVKTV